MLHHSKMFHETKVAPGNTKRKWEMATLSSAATIRQSYFFPTAFFATFFTTFAAFFTAFFAFLTGT